MSVQISKRRIQKLGGSSLIVTLPKTWVRKLGLSAGDEVLVVDEGSHLKILPSTSDTERRVKTLVVKYNSQMRNLDVLDLVACAFQRGYDWLYIYPSRSTLPEVEASLESLSTSEYVVDFKEYYDHVEIRIADSTTETASIVKLLRSDMLMLIEEAQNERLTREDLEEWSRRTLVKANEIAHLLYKRGVLACQQAPIDPVAVGVLKAFVTSFSTAVRAVQALSDENLRSRILGLFKDIILTLLGGISNGSMRRLGEASQKIEELSSLAEESLEAHPQLYAVLGFTEASRLLISQASCASIGNNRVDGQGIQ